MISSVTTVGTTATVWQAAKVLPRARDHRHPCCRWPQQSCPHRHESRPAASGRTGIERLYLWWLRCRARASDRVKSQAVDSSDIMPLEVATAAREMPLHELPMLLEEHPIRVCSDRQQRSGGASGSSAETNLRQANASARPQLEISLPHSCIGNTLLGDFKEWVPLQLNAAVQDGAVDVGNTNPRYRLGRDLRASIGKRCDDCL